jgi:hypothetical protein
MPALYFPNLSVLRLALSSGLVPGEIASAPACAGVDLLGRIWLELADLPPREVLAALGKLGVQVLGGAGLATEPIDCWAELLPLQKSIDRPAGTSLFIVPDRQASRFVARLLRKGPGPMAVSLRDRPEPPAAWITTRNPCPAILAESLDEHAAFEAFFEQIPGVWVRGGWKHPLPEALLIPPGHSLLIRPPRQILRIEGAIPTPDVEELSVPFIRPAVPGGPPGPGIPVRIHLSRQRSSERESLWIMTAGQVDEFLEFCSSADERMIRRLEIAAQLSGPATRLILRCSSEDHAGSLFRFDARGYVPDSRIAGLFLPAGHVLRPHLRSHELSRALELTPDRIVWLEAGPTSEVTIDSIHRDAFLPLVELVEYVVPPVSPLVVETRLDPFAMNRFVLQDDRLPGPERDATISLIEEEDQADQRGERRSPGWLLRSMRKLMSRLRREEQEAVPTPREKVVSPVEPALPAERRVEQKLSSREALRHGPDWAARRRDEEALLVRTLPRLGPEDRAARWASIAAVYTTLGNANDAAVCWMNAVWESPAPPTTWVKQWLVSECQAAKITDNFGLLDRWLSEPGRPGMARIIAAYTAWAGQQATISPEFMASLPRVLAVLDQHFDDLPVRGAWLARLAATRLCEGDALGLARWQDRVMARLDERGPSLDLDEPSFLRFHGTASAERFQTARDCLDRIKGPAVAWIQKHAADKRALLRAAGIQAETESTTAYAQFMLAWGLGCLGERTQAKDLAAWARKSLPRTATPRMDPAAHILLGELFLHRIKDAQEGRTPRPGLPAGFQARLEALSESARYAVDKLRERSRILEPCDRVDAFRGKTLKEFWGHDRLGERLYVLAERKDSGQPEEEVETLLALCEESPRTDIVPRVVLTLLEVAARMDETKVLRLLDLVPTALDWCEAWIAAGKWSLAERPKKLQECRVAMLQAAFDRAGNLADPAPPLRQLIRRIITIGPTIRAPLVAAAFSVFRTLRKRKLRGEAETLMHFLDGDRLDPAAVSPLGLAVGWFTAGNDDTASAILDEARDKLLIVGVGDLRERTELAIAYAETLGFAAPQISHGRLQEIFQRLGEVYVMGGTNQYYTLQLLQVVDAVVRSVVTDEFTLGPAVRGWLDDDEFLIRGRIHRDITSVLREQGLG